MFTVYVLWTSRRASFARKSITVLNRELQSAIRGSLTHNYQEKDGLNNKDLFFHGIEESVIRFSVQCKEN